jgi:hypothetical protein
VVRDARASFELLIADQICDERRMPIDGRDERNGTVARELADDDAELANARADVEALRQLHERIEQRQLEPGDWERLRALLDETYAELESSDDSDLG